VGSFGYIRRSFAIISPAKCAGLWPTASASGRTFESLGLPELMASPSVLISENYWQKRFAGDPAVLRKISHLNGVAFTIIGVTPHDFVGTNMFVPDFWLPLGVDRLREIDRSAALVCVCSGAGGTAGAR
jgi:hypothetical protein